MKAESNDKKEFILPPDRTVQSEKVSSNIFFESSGEYVLPDYMPKIEKLLRIETRALPPSRYTTVSESQMSGNLLHTLIYVGDEGEISATVLPAKYEFAFSSAGVSTPLAVMAVPHIEGTNCRPSAPRKLTVKTELHSQPRSLYKEDITPSIPNDESVHTLCKEIDTLDVSILRADNIGISESIELDAAKEARLIWCGATAAVTDARATEGGIQVRGEIYVKLLTICGSDAKMHKKKIPFEEFLDGELSKKASVCVNVWVVSTEASMEQNGESLVEVKLSVEAVACTPRRIETVFDAYSEKCEAAIEYCKVSEDRLLLCRSGVYNIGGSIPKNVFSGYSDMLDVTGSADVDEVVCEQGRITVNGRSNLQFIYKTDDGKYASAEYAVPFKISLDCDAAAACDVSYNAELVSVRTRFDGDSVTCDMDISLGIRAVERTECEIVKEVVTAGAKKYEVKEYPLCLIYPNGESLWSLAKKYHVSPEKLARINSLDIDRKEYTAPKAIEARKVLMLQF